MARVVHRKYTVDHDQGCPQEVHSRPGYHCTYSHGDHHGINDTVNNDTSDDSETSKSSVVHYLTDVGRAMPSM